MAYGPAAILHSAANIGGIPRTRVRQIAVFRVVKRIRDVAPACLTYHFAVPRLPYMSDAAAGPPELVAALEGARAAQLVELVGIIATYNMVLRFLVAQQVDSEAATIPGEQR
jgi:hypothetical protein